MTNTTTEENPIKKSKTQIIGVAMILILLVGHTASFLIPAITGQSPQLQSLFGSFIWSCLFFVFLFKYYGIKKVFGVVAGAALSICLFFGTMLLSSSVNANETNDTSANESAWEKKDLTLEYMRKLTKNQCTNKSIEFANACNDAQARQCLGIMAKVMADCLNVSKGTQEEYCASYDMTFDTKSCSDNKTLGCVLTNMIGSGYCDKPKA